jgi:SAM-dependent methyltransferase
MKFLGPEVYEGIENEGLPDDRQGFESSINPIFEHWVKETQPKVVVEVGSWKGVSACRWAQLAGPDCKVYCVDTWLGGHDQMRDDLAYNFPRLRGYPAIYFQFLVNVKRNGYDKQIVPIPNTSVIGALMLKDAGIKADLIWVDASHDGKDAYRDLCEYWELLRPGGIMGFDDFSVFTGCYAAAWWFNETHGLAKSMQLTPDKKIAWWVKP